MEEWLPKFGRETRGPLRAALEIAMRKDHGAVRAGHVLLRALEVVLGGHLGEIVLLRQGPASVSRPFGIQPPWGIRISMAVSRAA